MTVLRTFLAGFVACATAQPSIELSYFDIRGLGEPIRLMLAALGLEWTELKYDSCGFICPKGVLDWPTAKRAGIASGRLPFGQMPALKYIDDAAIDLHARECKDGNCPMKAGEQMGQFSIVQSRTIARFLAQRHNFGGDDEVTELLLDQIAGGVQDVRSRYGKVVYSEEWASKLAEHEQFLSVWMPYFEALLERIRGPYFAGSKLTYADIYVFDMLDSNLRIFPTLVQGFPRLTGLLRAVARENGVRQYLKSDKRRSYSNGRSAYYDTVDEPAPALHEKELYAHNEL